jgi:hypothetical protein
MALRVRTPVALVVIVALLSSAVRAYGLQEALSTVRVIDANAAIRVAALDDAPVIASPALASVLEMARSEDGWYVILLPADAQGLRRYGYLRQRFAERVDRNSVGADATKPALIIPRAAVTLAPDWQTRFRAAQARKSGAKAKVGTGIAVLAAGGALLGMIAYKMGSSRGPRGECSDLNPCYEYAWGMGGGAGLLIAGGMLVSRGRGQIGAADAELLRLRTELANVTPNTQPR